MEIIWHPSPNFAPRIHPVRYVILHGTWMDDDAAALARLCCAEAEVSAHYFIDKHGKLFQLVQENKVAWHAGISRWKNVQGLNAHSIGVEISNPGINKGVPYFPCQYTTLLQLLRDVCQRHAVVPEHVLGHSDIAPERKDDPGPHFNWQLLVDAGLARRPSIEPVPNK